MTNSYGRVPKEKKKSRIDRVLVNSLWLQFFPDLILQAGDPKTSDHKPIIWGKKLQDWGPKPFRFNNSWLEQIGFLDMWCHVWSSLSQEGWGALVLMKNLQSLKGELRNWKKQQLQISHSALKQCESEIKQIKEKYKFRDLNASEIAQLVLCKNRKKQLSLKDEAKKRLHSRIKWLKLGDKNTKFIHLALFSPPQALLQPTAFWDEISLAKLTAQQANSKSYSMKMK
ncbi:uncharacterized protein [Rutidosis leptorrhynchoides]|uniref:uncharacterized protein n=1 Tax=Rutidosis leptorrhynchoides TaxID=125765 RepID=UPI003A9A4958